MEPDLLPLNIRNSQILTKAQLDLLLTVPELPVIEPGYTDDHLKQIVQYYNLNPDDMDRELQIHAASLLDQDRLHDAWQVLLAGSC